MRDNQQQQNPPKFADKFLKWFCRNELHEEIIGDLHELWLIEIQDLPRWKGTIVYLKHIILFLRPYAFKKRQNSNYIMYRSYIKFALRNMNKHRGSTGLNILSLSTGIACFIFIFLYLKTELSYDRFHSDADLIHRVAIDFVDETGNRLPDATTPPALAPALKRDFPEVESSVRLFPNWGAKYLFGTKNGQKYNEEGVIRVDSTFFDVFTFNVIHGNSSTSLNNPTDMVITRSAAIKYFGKVDVLGEQITHFRSEDRTYQITAVIEDVPKESHFDFDFLIKLNFDDIDQNWGWYNYYTYIKLRPNANILEMEPKLQPFFEGYAEESEYYNQIYSQPLTDIHLKSHLKWELSTNGDINNIYIFAGLAIFILIISCLNYLNLTVAEGVKRFREVGVRKVFGAHKLSLVAQFITETVILTLLSLIIGGFLAEILFNYLGNLIGLEVSLLQLSNLSMLGIIGLSVLTMGILAGLYPALHLSSFETALAIKGLKNRGGKSIVGLRKSLLVIQFAISAFMIFGTIAVYKQLQHMRDIDKGFSTEHVLTFENARAVTQQQALKNELMKLPSVTSVGASDGIMGKLNWTLGIGYPTQLTMNYMVTDPTYLETMDFEFVAGRNFSTTRKADTIGYNMIVNETALKELGFTLDDVGVSKPILEDNDSIYHGTIIGVVKDFHFTDYRLEIKPFAFYYRVQPLDYISVKINSQNFRQDLSDIEDVWTQFANGAPAEYFFLEQTYADLIVQENRMAQILMYLTILAFFIAFIGMVAIANITMKDQRKEIAIRKVLGASVIGVMNMITWKFLTLVLIANAIAVPLAYFAAQSWLEGFVYRTDIKLYLFVIAIGSTLIVAWSIVGYQSFKTAISNPVKSLRQD
jgi:putative ABC transport system permease protein